MLRTHSLIALAAVLLAGATACKKGKDQSGGADTAVAGAERREVPVPPVDAAPPPTEAEPATVPASELAKDLPPFGPATGANPARAASLAREAVRGANGLSEVDPVLTAVDAVKADPGSPQARYALACVIRDEGFGLAQLTPLAQATDCPACVDALRNVATTGDCNWTESELALGASVKPGPQRAAAEALVATLASGDASAAKLYFKAARVEFVVKCSSCEDAKGDRTTQPSGAKLLAQLAAQVKKAKAAGQIIVPSGAMTCTADCCSVDRGLPALGSDQFAKVCFKPGTNQVQRLEMISGS